MDYTKEELCLIWLDSFLGLEYKHKLKIYQKIKDKANIQSLLKDCRDYIISEIGENSYNTLVSSSNEVYFNFVLEGLKSKDIIAVTIASLSYPEKLKQTEIPPLVLYAKGNVKLLDEESFGIVGSRKSLPLSISIAEDYTEKISGSGFIPVTGIAEGIDTAVIRSALKKDGKVISVVAGGFNNIYPSCNVGLADKIIEKGLLISENPPEVVPKRYYFPVRNRIIAGLSKGVLVVSAGKRSGAIYTAEYTEEYGRDLFAVPYSVGVAYGEGCNDLIKRGAMLTDTPEDILEFYGKKVKKDDIQYSEEEIAIIKALKSGAVHIEEICKFTGKKFFEIVAPLSMLEIKGVAVKNGVNMYGLIKIPEE